MVDYLKDFLPCKVLKIKDKCSLESIKLSNLSFDVIMEGDNLSMGDIIFLKKRSYKIHIVMPKQSLKEISKIYGIDEKEIKVKNNIEEIFVGQILKI